MTPTAREIARGDRDEWLRMRTALWPDDHTNEVGRYYRGEIPDMMVLVSPRPAGGLWGMAEWMLRPWADGCLTSPVGYLEGIWTDPDARRKGVASSLFRAGAAWARSRGCVELASDCALDNEVSYRFHVSLGFQEVERIICFRRDAQVE